ncbi:MAG: VanZ family protein [Clostridia bacterium]|nr:VanZ family protein [Clostridia bacterium]
MYFVISNQIYSIPLFTGITVASGIFCGLIFGLGFKNLVKNSYAVFLTFFYFLTVLILVMLPVGSLMDGETVVITPENNVNFQLDLLRPFKHVVYMRDFLLNLFMLVPFGFGVGLILPRKFWICVLICGISAFLLEALQLFSKSRVTDINDFIYNFLGALGGLILSRLALIADR